MMNHGAGASSGNTLHYANNAKTYGKLDVDWTLHYVILRMLSRTQYLSEYFGCNT